MPNTSRFYSGKAFPRFVALGRYLRCTGAAVRGLRKCLPLGVVEDAQAVYWLIRTSGPTYGAGGVDAL